MDRGVAFAGRTRSHKGLPSILVGVGSAREGFGAVCLQNRGVAFAGRTRSHKGLPSILVGAGSAREEFATLYLADRGVAFAGRTRSHRGWHRSLWERALPAKNSPCCIWRTAVWLSRVEPAPTRGCHRSLWEWALPAKGLARCTWRTAAWLSRVEPAPTREGVWFGAAVANAWRFFLHDRLIWRNADNRISQ